MLRQPPSSNLTATPFPYTTLFRSLYPDILPPMVEVATTYPGATSDVSAQTVAAPLEQQVNGAEGMIYLRSTTLTCCSSGAARSEEHTSELQSLMRHSYAASCLKTEYKKTSVITMTQIQIATT